MSLPPTSSAASPLAIEREFRALLLRLNYPTSARRQLQEIEYFLAKVLPQSRRYESYILEIVQRIPEIIQRMNIIGIDPESLRSVYENVKELNIALPSLSSVNGLAAAMQRLRLAISTLFTYVGEASTGTEFETEHVLDVEGSFTATTDSLLIPVVERSLVDTPGSLREFGSLRKISVEITGYSESGKDLFQPQVHVLGKGDHLQDVLAVPIRAARALLLQTNPGLHDTYFAGSVIFDELNSFHQGSSANLAIAALVYSALLRYVQAREQFSIKDNVTATGDINEGGDILPVDASSLRLKTEAVFFSGISFFVVPSSQLLFAEQVVDSLKTRYPNRRLVLVGLNNLREIFYDRRLSSQTVAGTIAQVARKAWKNKIQIAGIFTILVLLFVIARITVPPANDNPVAADLVGEKLFIRNSVGELLEQIEVGSATVAKALGPDGKPDPRKICRFFDIDGDGKNEFLYTEDSNPDTGFVSRLYCRSLWRKLTRWQISFREPYSFPRNPVGYRQHLTIDNFLVGKFDRDGTPEIFVTAHDMFFPCVVYKLNALTGKVLASYLHIGHLSVLGATDMNGDGSPEIVIAGWNNAFEMTAVAVLDPRLISGHSPLKETYKPENVKDGTEVFYVLIPPTTNAESMEDRPMNAGPQGLEVDTRRKTFNLTIADLQVTLPASRQVLTGSLICTFDSTMRVTNVNSTTTWDHAAQVLHKEGRLSKVPDAAYFNGEFARSMLYWDGDHWQHSPVMNKRYVKALKDMGLN